MNSTSTCSNAFEYKSIHDCNVHVTKCDNDNLNKNDIIPLHAAGRWARSAWG